MTEETAFKTDFLNADISIFDCLGNIISESGNTKYTSAGSYNFAIVSGSSSGMEDHRAGCGGISKTADDFALAVTAGISP